MNLWIFSGRPSHSAKLLCDADNFKRMKAGKACKPDDVVINWGNTMGPPTVGKCVLNTPVSVALAVNKLQTFACLAGKGVQTVPWTANLAIAKQWQEAGATVVARKVLTGSEGDGIIIVEKGNELPEAPLYTKYIFKVKEFRVHATRDEVIDTQQKVRDPDREPLSWKVRSYDNGFIFQRKGIEPNGARDTLAIQALKALGLDFGALDIVQDKKGNFYVLEVNTAPGIEGQTIQLYQDSLRKLANADH